MLSFDPMMYLKSYSQVPKDLNSLPGCRGYQAGQDGINHWVIDYNKLLNKDPENFNTDYENNIFWVAYLDS
jgi:hypothetical protein